MQRNEPHSHFLKLFSKTIFFPFEEKKVVGRGKLTRGLGVNRTRMERKERLKLLGNRNSHREYPHSLFLKWIWIWIPPLQLDSLDISKFKNTLGWIFIPGKVKRRSSASAKGNQGMGMIVLIYVKTLKVRHRSFSSVKKQDEKIK